MRVISGKYKRQQLQGYDLEGTRPTMDRVKEAIFTLIQGQVENTLCLDLFAGTGALGIEALSNGATECYFVDKNWQAKRVIQTNLNNLKITNGHFLNMDYLKALNQFQDQKIKFDLIFLDPPYKDNILNNILSIISNYLSKDGQVVVEYIYDNLKDNYDSLKLIKNRHYGEKKINIYQKVDDGDE